MHMKTIAQLVNWCTDCLAILFRLNEHEIVIWQFSGICHQKLARTQKVIIFCVCVRFFLLLFI